jgi:hypothetical protein
MEQKPTTNYDALTRVIRICEGGWWLPVYNDIIDEIMPHVSPTAWKVLWFVVGQSWIPQSDGESCRRRHWLPITYTLFQAYTGIRSRTTISRVLSELMAKGYLLRRQVGTKRGKPAYAYRLNWEIEGEVVDPAFQLPDLEAEPAQRSGTTL